MEFAVHYMGNAIDSMEVHHIKFSAIQGVYFYNLRDNLHLSHLFQPLMAIKLYPYQSINHYFLHKKLLTN